MKFTRRNSLTRAACLTLTVAFILATGATAQETKSAQMEIEGQPFVLNEFGAVIGEHDGVLEVEIVVMEAGDREPAYRKIDIKAGDQIVMINGKRAKTTADLEAIYGDLKTGDKLTMAIKRGQARQMISFPKGDPEAGGARIMVRTSHDGAGAEVTPILGLSLIVSEEEGQVSVVDLLPIPVGLPEDVVFKQKDVITKLQNQPVASVADLDSQYSAIATGDKVVLEILRDGEVLTFDFGKPEAPEGRIMMKKQ